MSSGNSTVYSKEENGTINIELVKLRPDRPFDVWPFEECVMNSVYETGCLGRELRSKLARVHFACLPIRFIKNILLINAEGGLLTRFR